MRNTGSILIIVAGFFWGTLGLFAREIENFGFSPVQVAAMRLFLAGIFFALIMLIKNPKGSLIKKRDIPLFLGLGLGSILFFTVCYFTALSMMSMGTTAILLYTSPIWVMIMSVLIFKEVITTKKIVALVLAFTGCALVSGIGGEVNLVGVVLGICSGIGYGLYSILGTFALRKYTPYTVTAYTFLIAGIGGLFICNLPETISILVQAPEAPELVLFIIVTALLTAVVPFLAYTLGLKSIEASKAAILATTEPIVATILGIVIYQEVLTPLAAIGILFVLSAIVLLNVTLPKRKHYN